MLLIFGNQKFWKTLIVLFIELVWFVRLYLSMCVCLVGALSWVREVAVFGSCDQFTTHLYCTSECGSIGAHGTIPFCILLFICAHVFFFVFAFGGCGRPWCHRTFVQLCWLSGPLLLWTRSTSINKIYLYILLCVEQTIGRLRLFFILKFAWYIYYILPSAWWDF